MSVDDKHPEDVLTVLLERRIVEALVNMGVTVHLPEKKCRECGQVFQPEYMIGREHIWCSGECASVARRRRSLAAEATSKP